MPKTKTGVLRDFNAAPTNVRTYFEHLPGLLEDFPLEVAIAYVFAQVELAHNRVLYCGIVKLHHADSELTRKAIDTHRMTRDGFRSKYEEVLGKCVSSKAQRLIRSAESTRDKVMHGKDASDAEKRKAISSILEYAELINIEVHGLAGFRPFGSLKGFKGRGRSLDKATTRWVLKGMGFSIS